MNLIRLLRQESYDSIQYVLLLIIVIGTANSLLIHTINSAAESIADPNIDLKNFHVFFYLASIFAFLGSRRYVLNQSCYLMENAVSQVRERVAGKIRLAELSTLENIGPASLYNCIIQDALYISNGAAGMAGVVQSVFMVAFMLIYLCLLSPYSFILAVIGVLAGGYIYTRDFDKYTQNWKELTEKEKEFFNQFSNILNGFKEIRINRKKNDAVYENYTKVNNEKQVVRVKVSELYNNNMVLAQVCFYAIFAAIIFILPIFHQAHTDIIIKVVATVLFIIGPLESILNFFPRATNADSSAHNILVIEDRLDKELAESESMLSMTNRRVSTQTHFFKERLVLDQVIYEYNNDDPKNNFKIGPINLTLNKGEIIFITGSNGSGKSTFMKVLTGLYMAKGGHIYLDRNLYESKEGTEITLDNHAEYRNLFTTIFTDYHLFDKLYGLGNIPESLVKDLMIEMELPEEKTTYKDGAFTNIRLSSGQKKRLALVNSILEDKDIYIYDEVAADLDPWFREVYYHKILAHLKAMNKIVFVVSHDKEFWQVADRILWMENGQLSEVDIEQQQKQQKK